MIEYNISHNETDLKEFINTFFAFIAEIETYEICPFCNQSDGHNNNCSVILLCDKFNKIVF